MEFFKSRGWIRFLFIASMALTIGVVIFNWWLINQVKIDSDANKYLVVGRLFGFLAAWSMLLQVILMSRIPALEQNLDLQENLKLHKYNGYFVVFGILGHTLFTVLGYNLKDESLIDTLVNMNRGLENVLLASIGVVLLFVVVFVTLKFVKRHLNYELWYFLHLTLYASILLTFLHQVETGADFKDNFWFTAYWYGLYALVFLLWIWYRVARPLIYELVYGFKINNIIENGANTYTVTIKGNNVSKFQYKAGQYATWRILSSGLWYQAHPFSFTSSPGRDYLQFTFKSTPRFTDKAKIVKSGTRVLLDGPRGNFTIDRAKNSQNIVLIAGGIGLAPFISTIGQFLELGKKVVLLYAVKTRENLSFTAELSEFEKKGLIKKIFVDSENTFIDKKAMTEFINLDAAVYICGPDAMSSSLSDMLLQSGMPKDHIITERFSY